METQEYSGLRNMDNRSIRTQEYSELRNMDNRSIRRQEYAGWRNMDNRSIYFIFYTYLFRSTVFYGIKYFSTVFLILEILTSTYHPHTSLFL